MSFVQELTWRGLVHQVTEPTLDEKMAAGPMTLYCGFDPTSDSLHVGSLLPILTLRRAQLAGHRVIALVGGATGMIGDPSGKSEERKLLSREDIAHNLAGIRKQLDRVLRFDEAGATLVNNGDWFEGVGYLEFLRDVGKHFSVNMMLAKESVRARLEDRAHGISYTEFSYMLVQAYDFLMLRDRHGCRLQIGGSDQWGNITAGIDLIRRLRGDEAFGLTMPLITSSSGTKFGKTEKGAVWLDPDRTSPYEFFQFFIHTDDRDVISYLKFFTFLDQPTIAALEAKVKAEPEKREAQRVLAREVTSLVHGAEEAAQADRAASALFGGARTAGAEIAPSVRAAELVRTAATTGAPTSEMARAALAGEGIGLVQLFADPKVALATSISQARRDLAGGGLYLNEERAGDPNRRVTESDLVDGNAVLLRKGKKAYHIVRFV